MIKEDYLALILEKVDVGEADRRYTFLTQENGLMRVVAKGVRKSGARLAAHLEDYTLSHVTIARNYGPGTLTGAYTSRGHIALRQNYEVMCSLTRTRRILLSVLQSEQPDDFLFQIVSDFLDQLDFCSSEKLVRQVPYDELLTEAMLHKVFAHMGYQFPLACCGRCNDKLQEKRNFFTPFEGGIVCAACTQRHNITQSAACDPSTIKVLRLMAQHDFKDLQKVVLDGQTVRQLQVINDLTSKWIMR